MYRFFGTSLLTLVAISALNAGQIQIGNAPAGSVGAGLSSGAVSITVGAVKKNYEIALFNSATEGQSSLTPPDGKTGATLQTATLSDTNSNIDGSVGAPIVFNMINDGLAFSGQGDFNEWGTQNATVTIPIGIFQVDKVWTMLNDYWGAVNAVNTKVFFNFGATAAATTGLSTVEFDLINGKEIRSAVDCTSGAACPALTTGSLTIATGLAASTAGADTTSTYTVKTSTVYTTAYDGMTSGQYAGTAGNAVLDDQEFVFGSAFNSSYLVNIQVVNTGGGGNVSRTAVSAVTVDTLTPEPSTMLMLITGLAVIGIARLRRKGSKQAA